MQHDAHIQKFKSNIVAAARLASVEGYRIDCSFAWKRAQEGALTYAIQFGIIFG